MGQHSIGELTGIGIHQGNRGELLAVVAMSIYYGMTINKSQY